MSHIANARSLLFVPGDRPDRFEKAVASGADVVILDLEDAVSPQNKVAALSHVVTWLDDISRVVVRINASDTPWHVDEVKALSRSGVTVVVPKSERPEEISVLVASLGPDRIIPLLETPRGIMRSEDIAEVVGVTRLAFGNMDLATALGVRPNFPPALAHARGRIILASASAGLPSPVDGVTAAFHDENALDSDVVRAREEGFGGKLCIHPRQVPPVNSSFSPSLDEIKWAREVIDAEAHAEGGVTVLRGQMLDAPVAARARAILSRLTMLERSSGLDGSR